MSNSYKHVCGRYKLATGDPLAPENIFDYIYAVLHSPIYRTRYAAFLKTDFPRVPMPADRNNYLSFVYLGKELRDLHLLEAKSLDDPGIVFVGNGDHFVKKMKVEDRYSVLSARVLLNDTEYFENVPKEAWEFQVGGYQPAAKWLADRKDRTLTDEDTRHYCRMIASMRDTVQILPLIDVQFQILLDSLVSADSDKTE